MIDCNEYDIPMLRLLLARLAEGVKGQHYDLSTFLFHYFYRIYL